jgi:hypothetical protein
MRGTPSIFEGLTDDVTRKILACETNSLLYYL